MTNGKITPGKPASNITHCDGAMRKRRPGARTQWKVVEVGEEAALTPNSQGEKELALPRVGETSPEKGTGPGARKR